MRLAEKRARRLEREISRVYFEAPGHVTVTIGTRSSVDLGGREVFEYAYGINLRQTADPSLAPFASTSVPIHAEDGEITTAVEKALGRS